ncbi:hypothetical protein DFQ27_001151 [Actinomortierella ambigua]|uniref:Uncharacterized protein n=1 Tax=Actinomortierella ambigua TaxID=1343610 RepID=A0A9P6TVT7_9FUNG|nr:hypothetical protein DFQ27_001151 [Actinomortierella ambigua]
MPKSKSLQNAELQKKKLVKKGRDKLDILTKVLVAQTKAHVETREAGDGLAVFGLLAAEEQALHLLWQSVSWAVFEAMVWVLSRSGFMFRSAALISKMFVGVFGPIGRGDEVVEDTERLLKSPLFRPFILITYSDGKAFFRLDADLIRITLEDDEIDDPLISLPKFKLGMHDVSSFQDESNPTQWSYSVHPLALTAMLTSVSHELGSGFRHTARLLPRTIGWCKGGLEKLPTRVPLWDALVIVVDMRDTISEYRSDGECGRLEAYIPVARAVVGTRDMGVTHLKELKDDPATMRRLERVQRWTLSHLTSSSSSTTSRPFQ